MKTINRQRLLEILKARKGAEPISFTALTDVKLKIKSPLVVKKLSRVNAFLCNYENSVRNRQEKEGNEATFKAKPRKWGTHITPHVVEHHKDGITKHYLCAQVLKARDPIYLIEQPPLRPGRRKRLIGVDKSYLENMLPEKRSQAAAQGVEKEIIHREYCLDSLSSVSMGGEIYHIIP